MNFVGNLGQYQKILTPEAFGTLPTVAVLVEAAEGDTVPSAVLALVRPNGGFDLANSEFARWFLSAHGLFPFLLANLCPARLAVTFFFPFRRSYPFGGTTEFVHHLLTNPAGPPQKG